MLRTSDKRAVLDHPMFPVRERDIAFFPSEMKPRLIVIVDAEEEFNWRAPFSASNCSVSTMSAQYRAQQIFMRYGVIPTYAVDFPVAAQEDGFKPLLEFVQSRTCEIGAQLHPWVTPPHEEEVCERNSFASNLPA